MALVTHLERGVARALEGDPSKAFETLAPVLRRGIEPPRPAEEDGVSGPAYAIMAALARAVSDLASDEALREWRAVRALDPRWRRTCEQAARTADLQPIICWTLTEIAVALEWLEGGRREPRVAHVELPRAPPFDHPFPLVLVGFDPGFSEDAFGKARDVVPSFLGLSAVEHDPRRGTSAYVAGFVVLPPDGLIDAIQLTVNNDWSNQTAGNMTKDDLASLSQKLHALLPVPGWEWGGEGTLMSERIMRPSEVVSGLDVVLFERRRQLWRRSVVEWGPDDVRVRRLGPYSPEHDDALLAFRVAAGFGHVRPRIALVWGTTHVETWWPPYGFPP